MHIVGDKPTVLQHKKSHERYPINSYSTSILYPITVIFQQVPVITAPYELSALDPGRYAADAKEHDAGGARGTRGAGRDQRLPTGGTTGTFGRVKGLSSDTKKRGESRDFVSRAVCI